jgi:hypothetical protein
MILHAGISLRTIWLRWWVSMGRKYVYNNNWPYRVFGRQLAYWVFGLKTIRIRQFYVEPSHQGMNMRQWLYRAKQQTTVCKYVCARETAGKGSWLRQKSSMLLMHERLAIRWRGMYSCSDGVAFWGVNTMIQGIACGTRTVLHCWRQGRRQPLQLAQ